MNQNFEGIEISKRLTWIIYMILQQSVAIISGYVISYTFDAELDNLWLWHKVCTSLGVVLIMFEGILVLSPENHLTFGLKKNTLIQIHGYILGIGLALMSMGNIFAIVEKSTHFTSLHGIVGLIGWILCGVCSVGGILTYYSRFVKDHIAPLYLKFSHILLGIAGFLLSLAALALGFYKSIDRKPTATPILMALTAWTGIAILIISGKTLLTHTRTIFNGNNTILNGNS